MTKKKKRALKFLPVLLILAVIAVGVFLSARFWRCEKKINPLQPTTKSAPAGKSESENFAFNFLKDNKQTVEIAFGGKVVRMSGIASDGAYETNGSETTYKHSDGRKEDRYVEKPSEFKHYTYYNSALSDCMGICSETETYTFENAVLHKNQDGEVKVYYFEDVKLDNAEADKNLLERASRTMTSEYLKDIYENGGPNFVLSIPIPRVKDKNGADVPVSYEVTGEKYNQLSLSFQAKPDVYPLTLDPTLGTTGGISNESPAITATVSDGGSSSSAPTNVGSNITFTTTAKDVNTDQYYLAVCKTNAITAGNDTAPTCASVPNTWAITAAGSPVNSDAVATVTYTTTGDETCDEDCAWYAFVCDKVASTAVCYPASGSGDQGLAVGTITFSGVPADTDYITVNSVAYEFDTNSSVTGGRTAVNISTAISGTDVAVALAAVEAGTTSHMISRASVVYVYADSAGVGGNSIGMTENQDTNTVIALSGSTLSGGSDNNASPFNVNHAPTFGTVSVSDYAGEVINPGDILYFGLVNAQIDDTDVNPSQNTINMYICTDATTSFNYSTNSCTDGSLICSATSVNPTTSDATCNESGNNLVPPSATHGTANFKVYVEDSHDFAGTGTNQQSYTIQNTAPTHDTPELDIHAPTLPNSVGYWQFEDGSSAVSFDDETTNNNNGSCTGGACPTWTQAGYSGGAYDFDGSSDFIDAGHNASLFPGTGSFTVSGWAYHRDYTYPKTFFPMGETYSFFDGNPGWAIGTGYSANGLIVVLNDGTHKVVGSLNCDNGYKPTDLQNQWAHVSVVFDRTAGKVYAYINGIKQTNSIDISSVTGNVVTSSYNILLGIAQGWYIDGKMDEIHMYNRALSATEISTLYTAYTTPSATSNMDISAKPVNIADHDLDTTTTIYNWKKNGSSIAVLNMPFDSNITSTTTDAVLDYSGNANHGTLGGGTSGYAPTWSSSGVKGGAYDFDGTDDYIDIGNLSLTGVNSRSIWFKPGSVLGTANMYLLDMGGNNYWIQLYDNDNDSKLELRAGAGSTTYIDGSYEITNTSQWYNVVVTVNASNLLTIYVNGSYDNSGAITSGTPGNAYMGRYYSSSGYNFDGIIDEVRVYNSALTAEQIAQNYNNGKPSYNTIVKQQLSAADTSWVADTTINDAQSSYSNSTTKSTNALDPANAEPVQGTPSARAHAPLDSGSVGYWQLEDGTGATAFDDETTNNNNGSCSGDVCPIFTAEGAVGGAYTFDGVNDNINLGNTNDISTGNYTLSAWAKVNSAGMGYILNKGSEDSDCATPGNNGYGMFINAYAVTAKINTGSAQSCYSITQTGTLSANIWHHVVFTADRSGNGTLYIDGAYNNSSSMSGKTNSLSNTNPLRIGSYTTGGYYWYSGSIDEAHIYNRVLSETEVKNLYNSNSYIYGNMDLGASGRGISDSDSDATYTTVDWRKNGTSAAVLNMSFNKNVTSTTAGAVTDYSSYANNGQLGGGTADYVPTWTNASTCGNNTGGCYSFDGTNDYVQVSDADSLDGTGSGSIMSWSFWLKPSGTSYRTIFDKGGGGTGYLMTLNGDGDIEVYLDSSGAATKTFDTNLSNGTWYHIAVVASGSSVSLYKNGTAVDSGNYTSLTGNALPLIIGRRQAAAEMFSGLLDEPRVYNRALTVGQISAEYNAGKPNYQDIVYGELSIGDTWKASVTVADANGNEDGTITSNELEILGFSTAPYESPESSTASPTNAGSNVVIKATANVASGRQWYLAVCKTNAVTAGNDAAPACATDQTWAISSATTDATEATATYTTSSGDAETNVWYAFTCDKVASVASCSPASQGSGVTGSPFVVNHIPALGTVKIGSQCGDTAPTAPGNSKTMKVTNGVWDVDDRGSSTVIQNDGKIIVAGYTNVGVNADLALIRYNTDGSLDNTFGAGGKVTTPINSGSDVASQVALQTDGKIVVAGSTYNGSNYDIAVVRYNSDGSLDTSFDSDGKVTTALNGDDWGEKVAIQTDGKIVVSGATKGGGFYDFAVVRYNSDGSLDTSFDSDGKVITPLGNGDDDALGLIIQGDGKIVVAGTVNVNNSESYDAGLLRYNSDGSLDTTFDSDGKLIVDMGSADDWVYDSALQADGKILITGSTTVSGNYDIVVMRFNPNGSPDTGFDTDGRLTTSIGSGNDWGESISVQPDGKIVVSGNYYNASTNYDFFIVRYNSDGSLDTSFNSTGKVTTAIVIGYDNAWENILQPDGKIILAGHSFNGSNYDITLARYNINGSLDATFDHDGKVTTAFGNDYDWGDKPTVQSDGKILVAGQIWDDSTNAGDSALVRYNTDGTLDQTFGINGRVITPIGSGNDYFNDVVVQNDGKIVAAGTSSNGSNMDFAVARYNSEGSLDTSFGTGGKTTTDFGGGALPYGDNASSVVIQSDGKIVVAGSLTPWDFGIARYNTDGTLDSSFGTGGKVRTDFNGNNDVAYSLLIQNDGKIVVVGSGRNGSIGDYAFAIARYNTDGSLDTSFGTGGKVITDFGTGNDYGDGGVIQPDGKIVVTGDAYNGSIGDYAFAVVRYNTDGSLDTSFGTGGKVITDFGSGDDSAYSAMIQADGKIVAGGESSNGSNYDFAVARYNTDGSLDTSFGTGGKVTTSLGNSDDEAWGGFLQSDGKIVLSGSSYTGVTDHYLFALVRYNTNGSVDSPANYVCVQGAITDPDTTETVEMHVCSTEEFSGGACTATTLCKITGVKNGDNAQCLAETKVPVPTAHGSYNVYVFTVDSHGMQGTGTSTQGYTVADVAPALVGYTATDTPDIAAGGSDTVVYSAVISDANGDNDVTAVEGALFDDTAVNNNCAASDNNCYIDTTCDLSNVSGTDALLTASCSGAMWFNSDASANWEVNVKPTDGLGKSGASDTNVNLTNLELSGIDIVQTSIAYGLVEVGGVSVRQETGMANMGNLPIDIMLSGTNMCTDSPTCAGGVISTLQQKWYHTNTDFNWGATATNPGPYELVTLASGTDDETGCLNRDIAVRTVHDSASTNESIWWKLRIPNDQKVGTYTGENTFSTTADTTCSTAQSY